MGTATAPGPPRNLAASAGDGSVELNWDPPTSTGGAAIDQYQYRFKTDGSYNSWRGNFPGSARSRTITNLTNGTEYTFQMRARNSVGYGTATGEATATPRGKPGAPPNLVATGGTSEVTLAWGAANPNGAEVTSYQVRYKTDGGYGDWSTVSGAGSARSETVTGLTNGTEHTFQVRARNRAGAGAASVATATPTGTATEPGAPRNLNASAGDGQVTLSWTAPSSDGGAGISSYQVRYKTDAAYGGWTTVTGGGSARSVTVPGLANGTEHTFQLRAVNSVGGGEAAEVSATPTADNAAPTFTEGSRANRSVEENASSGTAVGNPLTATDPDAGDTLTYSLEGTDARSFTVVSSSGQIRTRSGVVYDYEAKDQYAVTVRVSDGTASATIDVTIDVTDVDEPPPAPKLPRVTKTGGGTSRLVEWTAPTNTGRPDITGYDLRYREQGSSNWIDGPRNVSGTSATITGLNEDTEYEVQVRARNAEGEGDWSTEDATPPLPPPSVGPPSPPRNLTATAGDRSVELSWSRPVEDGGARIVRYEYRQQEGDEPVGRWQIIGEDRPTTDHRVTGLMNGVSYTFEVRAVNNRHASPPSEAATATPAKPEPVPALPLLGQLLLALGLAGAGAMRLARATVRW